MCCAAIQISANHKGKRSVVRLMALAACALYLAAMLLSSVFMLTHMNHIHDHDEPEGSCATCMHIQSAENLLKQLSTAVVSAAVAFGSLFGILLSVKVTSLCVGFSTLVRLKVRLNH
jgi:hypothetical protein